MKNKKSFRTGLLKWHCEDNKRAMPWKGEKDAYKVWLSEIILQQTRVEQGWSYYEKFIAAYPTVTHLANAKDEDVFKLWEGLGYYTRCKNLLHTARVIQSTCNGKFPSGYNDILSLKGIGGYTAAAIASFCFNLPYAVVDGNVLRILSRYFGISAPVDSTEGKKYFNKLAQECLDLDQPGEYNQAIMDFGATVCKPLSLCNRCPLKKQCVAFNTNSVSGLPVKEKSISKKERWFSYFIFSFGNKLFVRKRTAKDIWQNLYEFYLEESAADPGWDQSGIKKWLAENLHIQSTENVHIIPAKKQMLTHQKLNGYFILVELNNATPLNSMNGDWLDAAEIKTKAFPQFLHQFISRKTVQLQAL